VNVETAITRINQNHDEAKRQANEVRPPPPRFVKRRESALPPGLTLSFYLIVFL
jgi:hypothetical protein